MLSAAQARMKAIECKKNKQNNREYFVTNLIAKEIESTIANGYNHAFVSISRDVDRTMIDKVVAKLIVKGFKVKVNDADNTAGVVLVISWAK